MVGSKSKGFSLPPTPSLCMTISFVLTAILVARLTCQRPHKGMEIGKY